MKILMKFFRWEIAMNFTDRIYSLLLYTSINTEVNIFSVYTEKITIRKERMKKKTKKYDDMSFLQTDFLMSLNLSIKSIRDLITMILIVYNLPLIMCMRSKFMFLSMIIPSPDSSGRNIDDCLRPLIDELNQLWSFETLTYDVSKKYNFQIKTVLMWTINDFFVHEMISS